MRADDGQTLLALGVIRPYKGLPDAIEVYRRLPDARLLVAGDPAMELGELRDAPRTEWRLGYLTQVELDRALTDATVALFPYRAELDQSGALLQALGAGVPAVVYDVGGLAEPVARYGAGRVVPAADVEALTEAARELLADPAALAAARAGAERARAELTWAAAAARPSEAVRGARLIFRRSRFAEVIATQLDQFARRSSLRDRGGRRASRRLQRRGPRRGRGALRRLRRRGRDGHRAPRRPPRPLCEQARGGSRRALPARVQPRRRPALAGVRRRDREPLSSPLGPVCTPLRSAAPCTG